MNKIEFLNRLKNGLSDFPYSEVEKAIAFYSESIDDRVEDGMSEEDAVAQIDDIQKIVNEMKMDLPFTKLIEARVKESRNKATNKILWVVLAVCGSPIWLPIVLAIIVVLLSIYICLWSIVVCLYALLISALGTALGFVITTVIAIIKGNLLVGIAFLGLAICCVGLFVVFLKPIILVTKLIAKCTVEFVLKIKSVLLTKGEKI